MFASHRLIAAALCGIGLIVALFAPGPIEPDVAPAVGLAIGTIGLLATGALPEYVTALLFFVIAMLFAIAPAQQIFFGFQSSAFWLVFSGMVIGVALRRSGFANRLAGIVARRMSANYAGVIAGVTALGVLLALIMPSTMSRVMLLLPIVTALATRLGFESGSNGFVGIVLAASFSTLIPGFAVLPATVPAMVLAGASESLYGIVPVYGRYLLLHFPVLGALKALAIVLLILWRFPDTVRRPDQAAPALGPMRRQEATMAVLLSAALIAWMLDTFHGISPAWIGMAVACVLVLPRIGLVDAEAFSREIQFGTLFYIAGVLGLAAVVADSGIGDWIARTAIAGLELGPGDRITTFATMAAISALLGLVTTQPGVPAVLTPMSGPLADATAIPLESVVMMQVVGYSSVVLIYQTPPLVVTMQITKVPVRLANELCLWLLLVTVLVLAPLDVLWWRLTGWL